jgi:hypothetical protein
MLYHEWIRTRKFYTLAAASMDHNVSQYTDNLDEEFTFGLYDYGGTGFLEENQPNIVVDSKRYTCCFYNEDFSSNDLSEVEKWLYDKIVDEGGFSDPDLGLDGQCG